jgi:hypothetical protein
MSFGRAAKIVFQQDSQDKMLPFTFDLQPKDLIFIDSKANFEVLRSFMQDCIIIGIDTETKPMFYKRKRGESKNPTSIIQIAGRNAQYKEMAFIIDLIELSNMEVCMQELDELLLVPFTNEKCLVVGQGLDRDFRELTASYPKMQCFKYVNSVVETTSFVKCIEPEITYLVSLKYLVQKYLNCNLIKTQQTSNWGRRPLTEDQIHYAACDALVLLRLYDAMLCEAEVLSSCTDSMFTDNETAWTSGEEDETKSTDSNAPSVEQSGAVDKEENNTEPFSISSVLSVIDVSVPIASRRRQMMAQAAAQVSEMSADPTAELVREYTKDWSSPAARQWYASQLHSVATESTVSESEVIEGEQQTIDAEIALDDDKIEDEIHIPLPVGLGKHQYFQQPIVNEVVPTSESEVEEEVAEEDEPVVSEANVQQPTGIIHIAKRRRSNKRSCLFFRVV